MTRAVTSSLSCSASSWLSPELDCSRTHAQVKTHKILLAL